jgi:syntaxin 1B/2/3
MDLSHQLWTLVETARQQQGGVPRPSKTGVSPSLSVSMEAQQTNASLLSTSHTLSDAVVDAVSRASTNIRAVVAALDAATPGSTAHLQNSLLLSDAELLSVDSSLKAFTETLEKVMAVASANHCGRKAVSAKQTEKTTSDCALDSEMTRAAGGTDLAAHLQQVIRIQEQRVAAKRLQVALAKEELALYKSELFLYGHCGVLSCSDMVVAQLAQYRPVAPLAEQEKIVLGKDDEHWQDRGSRVSPSSSPWPRKPSRSGFGATFRVVDGMMQRAAQTVKAAGSHADSALHVAFTGSQAAARQLLNVGASSVDGIVMMSAVSGGGGRGQASLAAASSEKGPSTAVAGVRAIQLPPLAHDELTKEEETRLEKQSQALLQMQHEATAQDAKAVEASIRELSQLTSLMNEQVVQQTEQFSILVRNAEEAHTNVQKAVGEVKKPLRAFWNPTRQLIALLWACTTVVLAVNWVSR